VSKTLPKAVEKAVIWNAMVVCILSGLHMFLNGRTVTSEYYVNTSSKNKLKPTLPWNGYHGDVTQTQLVIDQTLSFYPG